MFFVLNIQKNFSLIHLKHRKMVSYIFNTQISLMVKVKNYVRQMCISRPDKTLVGAAWGELENGTRIYLL
jgi:hypothetical protein